MNQSERIAKLREAVMGDSYSVRMACIPILDDMEREGKTECEEFPEVGDAVAFEDRDDDGDPLWSAGIVHTEMFRDLLILQRPHFILMRRAELERRIEEQGK